ncbi:MAG: hypothetical protein H5T43_10235 [Methanomethylovorans sp.]|jgi:hypothetical protein|nr:hypothetical protein [Methanomethylovorans sp.]
MIGDSSEETGMEGKKVLLSVKEKEKKAHSIEDYFRGSLFALVALLLVISSLQFYDSVNDVISTWFELEYIPIIRAVFNLTIVIFCVYVIKFYLLKKKV